MIQLTDEEARQAARYNLAILTKCLEAGIVTSRDLTVDAFGDTCYGIYPIAFRGDGCVVTYAGGVRVVEVKA